MTAAAIWLVAGLLLGAAEMVAPGVFLLWMGLAAIGTGAATAAFGLDQTPQLGTFVALTVLLVGAAAWRTRSRPVPDTLNAPGADLIGMTCRALTFEAGEGRVTLRDGTWPARMAAATTPAPGETLRVVGLEGTTLLVVRLEEGRSSLPR